MYFSNFIFNIEIHNYMFVENNREIYQQLLSSRSGKEDIHTRLMKKYKDIPNWWFHATLLVSFLLALMLCIFMKDEIQMPWWALIFASGLALTFTLPISIITATTNQVINNKLTTKFQKKFNCDINSTITWFYFYNIFTLLNLQSPGLNIITEYVMGVISPGKPIANVCFKTYGYMSMSQAVSFLSDFKLGHYMKIPPRSMFIVQVFLNTIVLNNFEDDVLILKIKLLINRKFQCNFNN